MRECEEKELFCIPCQAVQCIWQTFPACNLSSFNWLHCIVHWPFHALCRSVMALTCCDWGLGAACEMAGTKCF